MRPRSNETEHADRSRPLVARAIVGATAAGLMLGSAALLAGAQAEESRPEQAGMETTLRYSSDAYTAPAPGTSGDRGVNRVYRDERLYRERPAQGREGVRSGYPRSTAQPPEMLPEYEILGAGAPGYQESAPNRGPRTSGDRGVNMPLRGNGDDGRYELFSQLDRNADDVLMKDEAKRATIIWRNFDALDVNDNGELSYAEFADIVDESEVL